MENRNIQDPNSDAWLRSNPEQTMEALSHKTVWCPAFITASMVFALLAVMGFLIIYLAVPFGALGIVFALLSRGNTTLARRARHAIVISVIAMCVSSAVTGYAFYRIYHDPQLKEQFTQIVDYYMDTYGLTQPQSGELQQPSSGESLIDYYLGQDNEQENIQGDEQDNVKETPVDPMIIAGGDFT